MEVNDKVFEFIQKIDSTTPDGLKEIETISGSLDAYINNCLSRCNEFENQIFQKRKLINELVKSSMENIEIREEDVFDSKNQLSKTRTEKEDADKYQNQQEFTPKVLKDEFLNYFFDKMNARLDIDETLGERLTLIQDKNEFQLQMNKSGNISEIKFGDEILLTSVDTNGLIESLANTFTTDTDVFRGTIVENIERYRDGNFSSLSFTSQ